MKIKLAILEEDKGYLNRIVSVFNTKYSDKFEIYSIPVTFEINEKKISIKRK